MSMQDGRERGPHSFAGLDIDDGMKYVIDIGRLLHSSHQGLSFQMAM